MSWYTAVLISHVAFGSIALITFWITALFRKGTHAHRQAGTVYLTAMLAVMVTALPLAGAAFAAGHMIQGIFLMYLIVITGTPLWVGRRAVRQRHSAVNFARSPYRLVGVSNVACALIVLGLGFEKGAPLLEGLSAVGLFVGIRILRFASSGPSSKQWWLKQHYLSMVGSGLASHIAFLNVGLPRMLPAQFGGIALYVAWFSPLIAALMAGWWLNRRYGKGPDGVRLVATGPLAHELAD